MKYRALLLAAAMLALAACSSKDKKVDEPAKLLDIKSPTVRIQKIWGASAPAFPGPSCSRGYPDAGHARLRVDDGRHAVAPDSRRRRHSDGPHRRVAGRGRRG